LRSSARSIIGRYSISFRKAALFIYSIGLARRCSVVAYSASRRADAANGIIGKGESETDRPRMLKVLSNFDPPPESVPINCLMAMPGTPLADQPPVDIFELIRLIALTRIALPKARVCLAAGRTRLWREGQALCFFAGANSIFYSDELLTAKNPVAHVDVALLRDLSLHHSGLTAP
jgi:biotin synthase-like enzyme